MDADRIKGQWKELKGKALEQWGELTNDELDQADGNREQLEGLIQKKYGRSKDEVRKEVDDFLSKY